MQERACHGPCKLWIDSDITLFSELHKGKSVFPKFGLTVTVMSRIFLNQESCTYWHENFRFRTQLPSNDQVFFFRFGKKTWCIASSQSKEHYRKGRKDGPQFGLFHPFEKKVKGDGQEGRRQGTDQNQTGIIAVNP